MNDIILVTGAGGFIGGHLTKYFANRFEAVRAVDKKPLSEWYQVNEHAQSLCLDLSDMHNAVHAVEGVGRVYNLAADMGGMGFIEKHRVDCLRSVLISTNMLEASYRAGVKKYFYSSSACAYNIDLQQSNVVRPLKESDAYPANPERGYGWEKLFSEIMCQEYYHERGLETHIARFHNVYGPNGTWFGGREKAPAALCRKVIEAKYENSPSINIWGDGTRTRSYMYIDDCINGIVKIMDSDELIATPVNLGASELVSVDELVTLAEEFAGIKLKRVYEADAPLGVVGRNSDNTFIESVLGWQPSIPISLGLKKTYEWIETQYLERHNGRDIRGSSSKDSA